MKYIISAARGGLSNRIKCLISSMKIAEKTGRKIILYWPKDPACNNRFSDLFENEIEGIEKEELRKILKSQKGFLVTEDNLNFPREAEYVVNGSSLLFAFGKDVDYRFNEVPKEASEEITRYIKKIKIRKEISDIVKEFYNKKFNKNTIGIHIRKGDFVKIKDGIGSVSSEEMFREEIKKNLKENKKVRFFLATEDLETEKRFKDKFRNKVTTYPKKTKSREEDSSVREALIEMLLLSKSKKIFGTFGSSFTEMAWIFGDCKQEVKIIVDEENLKRHLFLRKKKKNLISEFKRIVYETINPAHKKFLDRV